ncbi:hypothetical protein [Streptomyces sp. 769]|uniref:hypothetical protein n=1 Tax=Streptomyces sp. 769 TaxID=1262452 RepID=UPI000A68865E|nr:hypothetical protein [Streptomyces sp. 769]
MRGRAQGLRGRTQRSRGSEIAPLPDRLDWEALDLAAVAHAVVADPEWADEAVHGRLGEVAPCDAEILDRLV